MAAVTPVDTNPASTLRHAAERLRSGLCAAPTGAMTATTKQAAAVALVERLRLPLAKWLEDASARVDQMTYLEWRDGVEAEALAVAHAVLGEQR